jgi:hypothetical protein
VEEFYDYIDMTIPKALRVAEEALSATRFISKDAEVPDWKHRLIAAELFINKRIGNVKAIEVSGPGGGAVEIDLETRFSALDDTSFSKEFEKLLHEIGKEQGTEGS